MMNKKELGIIASLSESSFNHAEKLHSACAYAIRKAYAGNSEFAQAVVDAVRVKERIEVAGFLKRWGLNTDRIGTTYKIGGPRNQKMQRKHVTGCADDIGYFRLVDAHVPTPKSPKEPEGTFTQQANDALKGLIDRMKKQGREEVAALIGQRAGGRHWSLKFDNLAPTTEDIDAMMSLLTERIAARTVEVAQAA